MHVFMRRSREHSKRLSNLIRRGGTGFGARPERADLFNSMLFPGRVCLHMSGVLFLFWRLAEKQPRHGEASGRSGYPGLVLCGWWVMEEGSWVCKMKLEQPEFVFLGKQMEVSLLSRVY